MKNLKWLALLFYLSVQVVAALGMLGLEQQNAETLFLSGQGLKTYGEFLKNFEEQKILLVKLGFSSPLDENAYRDFREKIQSLGQKFPEAEILSFFELYHASLKSDSLEAAQALLKQKPDLTLKFVGSSHVAFLAVFEGKTPSKRVQEFIQAVQSQNFSGKPKIQMAGLPYINFLLDRYSRDIQTELFPLLFVVVFLATFIFTRNFLTSVILFVPALGSLTITLSLIRWFYSSMNMVTSIVPLLIFVLNLSLAFHFFFTFLEYGSLMRALREKQAPFLLMIATTAIGFGSLMASDIPAIRQFGVLSFPAILLSSGLTYLWAHFLFPWRIQKEPETLLEWIPARFFHKTWSYSTVALLAVTLILATFFVFPHLAINTDATTYFPDRSGLQKSIRSLESEFLGTPLLEVDLSRRDSADLSYGDLLKLSELEQEILQEFGGRRRILSANEMVREANYLYTGEKKLPPIDISYFTLKSQAASALARQYSNASHYRLTVWGPTMDYSLYQGELKRIQKILDRFPAFRSVETGVYYQIMQSQNSLIWILTVTFLLRLFVMSLLFYLYFRRLRWLLIFLLANEIPVLACVLFLWVCRFSLNVATVMVFPVSIGIVVGNTIHVVYALTKEENISFEVYFKTVIIPVLLGSTALVLGFALLGFYGFLPIRQFGTALSFTVLVGMFSALYLVPTLVLRSSDLKGSLSRGIRSI